MTTGFSSGPQCKHCEHPINFGTVNESNNYACPNCGKFALQKEEHCWVKGCMAPVINLPDNMDGCYGNLCEAGHSFRMHPEWGMGGTKDMAKWTQNHSHAFKQLHSLPNPNQYKITDQMIYFWLVSGAEGKAMIEKLLSN
jgi:predicted RNA-binding Zn-ribbon protein involved in translation (DUF1610 family)